MKHHDMNVLRSVGVAPRSFNLSNRWWWVINSTLRLLYPRYPLDRRLGGPQSRACLNIILCMKCYFGV